MVSLGYDSAYRQVRKTMNWKPDPGMTERQIRKAVQEKGENNWRPGPMPDMPTS